MSFRFFLHLLILESSILPLGKIVAATCILWNMKAVKNRALHRINHFELEEWKLFASEIMWTLIHSRYRSKCIIFIIWTKYGCCLQRIFKKRRKFLKYMVHFKLLQLLYFSGRGGLFWQSSVLAPLEKRQQKLCIKTSWKNYDLNELVVIVTV